jgi:hypothetical protein
MRLARACGIVLTGLALSCCGSAPEPSPNKAAGRPATPAIPPSVGNGFGSEHGNYAAQMAGETTGASGERCVLYVWDRPLTRDLALRIRSSSCESQERPGWMISKELSRTVVPMSESSLKEGGEQVGQ